MSAASAATLGFRAGLHGERYQLTTLTGAIEPGDADRLVTWFKAQRDAPYMLVIDSPGGSVGEAIRIAQVVKKLALIVSVAPNRLCASACFIVFAAGVERDAWGVEYINADRRNELNQDPEADARPRGFVGLHRPFQAHITSPENSQSKVMKAVTAYLEEQMLPRRLIDIMMTRPSSDIYWLNKEDLKQLGEFSPDIEEYFIQKCGYDRNWREKLKISFRSGGFEAGSEAMRRADKAATC